MHWNLSSWGDSEECGTGMWGHVQYVFLFGCYMSLSIMNGREPNLLSCPQNRLWGLLVSGSDLPAPCVMRVLPVLHIH